MNIFNTVPIKNIQKNYEKNQRVIPTFFQISQQNEKLLLLEFRVHTVTPLQTKYTLKAISLSQMYGF